MSSETENAVNKYFSLLLNGVAPCLLSEGQKNPGINASCSVEFVDGTSWPEDLDGVDEILVSAYLPHGVSFDCFFSGPDNKYDSSPRGDVFVPYHRIAWIRGD